MKMGIAQIDARLGDIDATGERIFAQASLASKQGVQLLCFPAPIISSLLPTSLIDYGNFEHCVLKMLVEQAKRLAELDIVCLVPAVVSFDPIPVLEVFMLREGNAVPLRCFLAKHRGLQSENAWIPPVFDVAGTRVAVTFDLDRDMESVPGGTDVIVYLQIDGFSVSDESSAAVASVRDGYFLSEAEKSGMWLACVAPVGAFDESVYTGGSFVMDDAGHVVEFAPCFEEALLTCDVRRGLGSARVDEDLLPRYSKEEWLWGALCLQVRSVAAQHGTSQVVVPLEGDLPSSLLAALSVDAFGPRNVCGLVLARQDMLTSAQEAFETERLSRAREVAERLHIRLVERELPDLGRGLDSDEPDGAALPGMSSDRLRLRMGALMLSAVAEQLGACVLAPYSKTGIALAPGLALSFGAAWCDALPFGDVYLTKLEYLARWRNRRSAVVPEDLVSLRAVEHSMGRILDYSVRAAVKDPEFANKIGSILLSLSAADVDGTLEAHVDRNRSFEEIPLAEQNPQAVRALLLLVQGGEDSRRKLPLVPVVSSRSFGERLWPRALEWSDFGRSGEDLLTVADLVREEEGRAREDAADAGERMQNELMGFLGSLFGIAPDQLKQAASTDGEHELPEGLEGLGSKMKQMFERALEQVSSDEDDGRSGTRGGGASFKAEAMGAMDARHLRFFSQN